MRDLLFDTPWWLLIALLAGGAALFRFGNNRQDKALQRLGLTLALLSVAMGITSWLIDTDQERCVRLTKNLVHSIEQRDWPTLTSILDAQTNLAIYHNKDELLAGAKKAADDIGLKSVHIIGSDVTQHDTVILINYKILSEQERTMGQQIITNWQFQWENLGTGWKLHTITPLPSEQVDVDAILKNLSRGK